MQKTRPVALILLALQVSYTKPEKFQVGYLTGSQRRPGDMEYSRPGTTISGALTLAIEELNFGLLGSRGHSLDFMISETYGDETTSIRETANLINEGIFGFIGPQETCVHEGRIASAFNLPMISYFCTDYEASNKKLFPTFARTRPPDTQISKSVASVLLKFNWTKVTFLYSNDPDSNFDKIGLTIISVLQSSGINVIETKIWDTTYHYGYTENPFIPLVRQTFQNTRREYFVVGVNIEPYDAENPEKYLKGLLKKVIDPYVEQSFQSYIGIMPSPSFEFENFSEKVNEYLKKPPFNFTNPLKRQISIEAAYLYDAVHLYGKSILQVLDSRQDPKNGTLIIENIKRCNYRSALGYMVYVDENGDAEGNYTIVARKMSKNGVSNTTAESAHFGLYPVGMFTRHKDNNLNLPEVHIMEDINWINGYPPVAEPACGFKGERCISHTLEIVLMVFGAMSTVMLVILTVLYRNWKYEQELDSLLWKVDYKEIEMNDPDNHSTSSSKISRTLHPFVGTSQVSLSSNPDMDFRYSAIFTTVGMYRGRVFAVKKIKKKFVDLTRDMKKELKVMRDLRHDNINGFIGACTEPPNICIVTEYCSRGSLKDILENEEVKLDNMFISSLVSDILRGMLYLHESLVHCHGNLKPSNCLVDSRWVLKLTDFGLNEFKKECEDYPHHFLQHDAYLTEDPSIICKCEGLLYRAPELLRDSQLLYTVGDQKGDIYSFGIILYEINGRQGPFGSSTCLTISEILRNIVNTSYSTSQPFRPPLDELDNSFDFVRDCLKECWSENPEQRPDFKIIRNKLRPMRKGMRPNIFDNMMAMMEKYATNLEVLVDERTDQLVEEKKKTDALLYEMLPRYVAEQLKRGNKVDPECFDWVTIYFSDIVGFTAMSAESTPLEVVDFLNDLYTCFDSIIENYDVYKVETIGDAYMVVSGLPIRNGDNHAAEIATMSLHLLEEVKRFRMRHRPYDNLMLRIGIHSGPVCAGVVGLKMPRYCLFGDTVNTASRMESTGNALKIHCSSECKLLLDRLGGYTLLKRGLVGMKGKGEVLTYWLIGEDTEYRNRRYEERMKRRQQQAARKHHNLRKSRKYSTAENSLQSISIAPTIGGQRILSSGTPPILPSTTVPTAAAVTIGVHKSSLKNRNRPTQASTKSIVSRCVSLESPKKLRFGGSSILDSNPFHKCSHEPLIEIIFDDIPLQRRPSRVSEIDEISQVPLSKSCPCIENLAIPNTNNNNGNQSISDGSINNNNCSNCHLNLSADNSLIFSSSNPCVFSTGFTHNDHENIKQISDPKIPLLNNNFYRCP